MKNKNMRNISSNPRPCVVLFSENQVFVHELSALLQQSVESMVLVASFADLENLISICEVINIIISDNNRLPDIIVKDDFVRRLYKVSCIINCSLTQVNHPKFINFKKPLRLGEMRSFVSNYLHKCDMFVSLGECVFDERAKLIAWPGHQVDLTSKETELISFILSKQNFSASKKEIMNGVWKNYCQESDSTTLDVHLTKLRKKTPDSLLIVNSEKVQINLNIK